MLCKKGVRSVQNAQQDSIGMGAGGARQGVAWHVLLGRTRTTPAPKLAARVFAQQDSIGTRAGSVRQGVAWHVQTAQHVALALKHRSTISTAAGLKIGHSGRLLTLNALAL